MNLFTQSITNQPYYSFIILLKWLTTLFQKPQLTHLKYPRTPYYLLLLIRKRFVKYFFWFIDSLFWKLSKKKQQTIVVYCFSGLRWSFLGKYLIISLYVSVCISLVLIQIFFKSPTLLFSYFRFFFPISFLLYVSVMLTEILFIHLLAYFVFLLLFVIF